MQIEALKIYCDVVRHSSFSRAAAENEISQSSASQAVLNLEDRLGVKLIDRSKRPLVATAPGRVFFDGCRDLIQRYDALVGRVGSFTESAAVGGTVRLAAIYSVGLSHLTRHIERFRAHYPSAECRLDCMHPDRVLESVREGVADVGVVSFPKKWPDLTVLPWRDEPMVLAVAVDHPLVGVVSLEVGRLDGVRFVHFDADLAIRRAIDRALRAKGVEVDTVLTFDNVENIKRAVELGAGAALLPEPSLAREVEAGTLVALRLADFDLKRPLAIVHRGSASLSIAASRLLDELSRVPEPAEKFAASPLNAVH